MEEASGNRAAALEAENAALREQLQAYETITQFGSRLVAELDLNRLLQAFLEGLTQLTGAAYGAYFEKVLAPLGAEAAQEGWRLSALAGAPAEAFTRFGLPRATALFSPTFLAQGVIRLDDVLADPRYGSLGGMPRGHLPVRSYMALPVLSGTGESVGALLFGHPEPGRFGEREERLATGLAWQAAIAIDNARLFAASRAEIAERAKAQAALAALNDTLEERILERSRALMQAEERLRQSQKMEAVGQLTGGLAHDFNNLLTGISGSLELLQIRIAQGRLDDLDRYLRAARAASDRAAALTHRLLAFSRRQTLAPRATDINRLVAGMEELIRRTMGPDVTVEVIPAPGLWATLVDNNQLENALLNLCINARDAMPEGGRLTIETANRCLDEAAARAKDLPPGQYVSLVVRDTGTGMSPEVAARAFDPFFTTKPLGVGTGLGLSMVYGFVRQSGGQARILTEPGQGTTIWLNLPRHHGPAETEAEPAAQAGSAPAPAPQRHGTSGETVLVVDDEAPIRMLVSDVLSGLGHTTLEAEDGAAALRLLRSATPLDLLITDVGLPGGMNGRQLAEAARALRPGLKVLFITGYAESTALSHGHLGAGMRLLAKPFTLQALAGHVRTMLAGSAAAVP
ncbi:ATP-binding protein [Teichococcus aestuarii]|uniref:ATP-binding protein n=1 Tax=Teichococcus aestuarii TaxID=568898 RepID=UPI003606EFC9